MRKAFWLLVAWFVVLPWAASAQTDLGAETCALGGKRLLTVVDQADGTDRYVLVTLAPGARGNLMTRVNITSITGTSPTLSLNIRIPDLADGSITSTVMANSGASWTTASDNYTIWTVSNAADTANNFTQRLISALPQSFHLYIQAGGTITDLDFTVDCWTTN